MVGPKLNWRAWFKSLFEPPHGVADSLLARGSVLQGELRFRGVFYLAGEVHGPVIGEPGAMLVILPEGRVGGDLRCPFVVVGGEVQGDIHSEGHVHLEAGARVAGHVYYRLLEMHSGAQVAGHLVRQDERHAQLKESPQLKEPSSLKEQPELAPASPKAENS
ncbi:MAG: polymer-forming cytoskeletal protein [Gammaproteobacteria bacterium]|nr:polymer-forming cytoskeletal protein [Gammaproteobacteria bacterium]